VKMSERENVVQKAERIMRSTVDRDMIDSFCEDVIALLKEQEAVEPRRDANCVMMFRCGVCGEYVGFIDSDPGDPNEQDNYCRNCGRKVKWE